VTIAMLNMNTYLISSIPIIQAFSLEFVIYAILGLSFCPTCLNLRNRAEEYVNGYCIYETKYMTELLNRISTLEVKIESLEST